MDRLRPTISSRHPTDITFVQTTLVENTSHTEGSPTINSPKRPNANSGAYSIANHCSLHASCAYCMPTPQVNAERPYLWTSYTGNISTYSANQDVPYEQGIEGERGTGNKVIDVQNLNEFPGNFEERGWICCACQVKNPGPDGCCLGCGDEVCEWCKRVDAVGAVGRVGSGWRGGEGWGMGDGTERFEMVELR